jgi:hypothetical protein
VPAGWRSTRPFASWSPYESKRNGLSAGATEAVTGVPVAAPAPTLNFQKLPLSRWSASRLNMVTRCLRLPPRRQNRKPPVADNKAFHSERQEHLVSSSVGLKREFWSMSCSLSQKLTVVALLLSPFPSLAAGSGGGASGSGGCSSSGTAGGSTGASPSASTGGPPSSGAGTTLSNGVTMNGTGGAPGANASNAKSQGTTGNNLGPAGTPGSSNTLNNAVGNLGNTNTGVTAPSSNSSVQAAPSGK